MAERVAALEFLNSEVTKELDRLSKAFDTLDTKALGLMGFVAVAVPFVALNRRDGPYWLVPVAVYALCALAGFFALWPRKLHSAPAPDVVVAAYHQALADQTPNVKETLLAVVLGTKSAAYAMSFETSRTKLRWFRRCQSLLIAAFLLSMFAVAGENDDRRSPSERPSATSTTSVGPGRGAGQP